MAVITASGRGPLARLSFATDLSICLLLRDWAGIEDSATRGLRVRAPLTPPSDNPLVAESGASLVGAWQSWWNVSVATTTGSRSTTRSPDSAEESAIVAVFGEQSHQQDVRSWAAREKRAFTSQRQPVLPPQMGRRTPVPLTIHAVAAEGRQLIALADDHLLVTADLLNDPDTYFRLLTDHINNIS